MAGVSKAEADEATKWIGGLDRIHRSRGILATYDFSATPFVPSGKQSDEEALFGWIVCDFGLNDAIEAGLVKTPRVVVRDDALPGSKDYKSKLYHIYNWVKADLNRKAEEHEGLPDLVRNAYVLLGADWRATLETWNQQRRDTPPVMITVANRTETAARVKYAFDRGKIPVDELKDPARTLHIDSKVLEKAEAREDEQELDLAGPDTDAEAGDEEDAPEERPARKLTKDQQAERLRRIVDTVGRLGEPGAEIQHVVSVGMLTEGWDARTVTHIMGLRAFTSQLLCEQVVGRGLRRTSYEVDEKSGLFEPEYVNIFGIPFTFLPHEGGDTDVIPPPPKPKSIIAPDAAKAEFAISWPNVLRIENVLKPQLTLELDRLKPLELFATDTVSLAELAPIVEGKPDVSRIKSVDLERLAREFRMQRIAFEVAAEVFDQMQSGWAGRREWLLAQIVGLVERFLASDRIMMFPELFMQDPLRRRIVLALNMNKVVRHLWEAIRFENRAALQPVFDAEKPIRSTGDMLAWGTGRPWEYTKRSHINRCVFDSTWEACEAFALDHDPHVLAWVKNDHLGFEIVYVFEGVVRKFRPDFLVGLTNGVTLVLEVKGQDSDQNRTKRRFLDEWVQAVNAHGGFGRWASAVSRHPADVAGILAARAAD